MEWEIHHLLFQYGLSLKDRKEIVVMEKEIDISFINELLENGYTKDRKLLKMPKRAFYLNIFAITFGMLPGLMFMERFKPYFVYIMLIFFVGCGCGLWSAIIQNTTVYLSPYTGKPLDKYYYFEENVASTYEYHVYVCHDSKRFYKKPVMQIGGGGAGG